MFFKIESYITPDGCDGMQFKIDEKYLEGNFKDVVRQCTRDEAALDDDEIDDYISENLKDNILNVHDMYAVTPGYLIFEEISQQKYEYQTIIKKYSTDDSFQKFVLGFNRK